MTKQLKAYFLLISSVLANLNENTDKKYIDQILQLHHLQTHNFQHERLIHLLITLFFACIFFASIICTAIWPCWQFMVLDIIVLILLAFYIQHYFFLENTIQKLYPMTQTLIMFSAPHVQTKAFEKSVEK